MRKRVNKRVDRKVFARTASKINVKNIPGKIVQRGGIRL